MSLPKRTFRTMLGVLSWTILWMAPQSRAEQRMDWQLQMDQTSCDTGFAGSAMHACERLAKRYLHGRGVPKDEPAAAKLFGKSCDAGLARSCIALGLMYREGRGVASIPHRADGLVAQGLLTLERHCGDGDADACLDLGDTHASGTVVARDAQLASALFQKAAQLLKGRCLAPDGDRWACFQLGELHEQGTQLAKDPRLAGVYRQSAMEVIKKDCDGGEVQSCLDLAEHYERGQQVPRDETRAQEAYRNAAAVMERRCADPDAIPSVAAEICRQAGDLYRDGKGVEQNSQRALALYKSACEKGDREACDEYERLKG